MFLILPFVFMPYAVRQWAPEHRNMRLIFMVVVAMLLYLGAMMAVFTDQGGFAPGVLYTEIAIPAWNQTDRICLQPYNSTQPPTCTYMETHTYGARNITDVLLVWPACRESDPTCIPTFFVAALLYGGMGTLFAVLAISEAFILVLAASQKRRGEM